MLCILAFAESSFFPIPPDVLLIPLVLGSLTKWARLAFWCTLSSVLGGILGYYIGLTAWDPAGIWIIKNILHLNLVTVGGRLDIPLPKYMIDLFGENLGGEYLFQAYDYWNAWIVFVFGMTPLPYKLVTISAGFAQVNFGIFVLASLAARGGRFFLVSWILRKWGHIAKDYIDRYFNLFVVVFTVLLIGSFVLVKIILK
ncbi:MAG: DedA family protein [Bdellovibrionota bacterium]